MSSGARVDAPNNPRTGGVNQKGSGSFNLAAAALRATATNSHSNSGGGKKPSSGIFSKWRRSSETGRAGGGRGGGGGGLGGFIGSLSGGGGSGGGSGSLGLRGPLFCPGVGSATAAKVLACGSAVEVGLLLQALKMKEGASLLLETERRGAAGWVSVQCTTEVVTIAQSRMHACNLSLSLSLGAPHDLNLNLSLQNDQRINLSQGRS